MRVALTTQPGSGHLHTLLGLALALGEAGHEPTLHGAPGLRGEVEGHGVAFAPAGVDWRESALATAYPEYVREEPDGMLALDLALWADLAEPFARDLEALWAWRAPAVVVSEAFEYGGQLAAERRGLPYAVVDHLSAGPVYAQRERFAAPLDPVRAALGLPPDPDGDAPYRHLRLLPVPPVYDPDGTWPPTGVPVELGLPGRPPPDLGPLPPGDAPLVLASLGTVLHARSGAREAMLDAVRDAPARVVLALGPDAAPAEWGPVGANVRLVERVPQPWLLPRCAAFVTHGGATSIREALIAGTPMVVLPLGFDQRYHGRRCAALGLARWVAPRERTAEAIRAALEAVLGDPGFAEAGQAFAREMAALPRASHAIGLLEDLAAGRTMRSMPG